MKTKYLENTNEIHVGQILKKYIDSRRIAKSALARKINRDDSTILYYQKSGSLQSAILIELSMALKHNFFADIASLLPDTFSKNTPPDTTDKERIAQLEQEVLILKAEKEVLIKVMNGNLRE